MSAAPQALLDVDGLSVAVRGGRPLVEEASLRVDRGRVVGLVGESGSGKTTVCRAVAALLADDLVVTSGSIRLHGRDVTHEPRRRVHRLHPAGVAMVFQDPARALNPVLSVGRQLVEAVRAADATASAPARERAVELLEAMGLDHPTRRLTSYPHELSGGQRQRVMLAIALAKEPALLVADEPTSAVDVSTQAQILDLLTEISETRGVGVLLVTHDFGVVSQVAHDVVVMYAGHVLEAGPAADVLRDPCHPYTRALLECLPSLHRRPARLPVIASAPQQTGVDRGCPFYGRCPEAERAPCHDLYVHRLGECGPGHATACVREPRRAT